jgi:hypothetical protein
MHFHAKDLLPNPVIPAPAEILYFGKLRHGSKLFGGVEITAFNLKVASIWRTLSFRNLISWARSCPCGIPGLGCDFYLAD